MIVAVIAFFIASSKGSGAQAIMNLVENAWAGFGSSFGPVILLSLVLTWGFRFCPGRIVRCVEAFGNMISKLGIVGIAIGSISYLTGVTIIGDFTPVMESMAVAAMAMP